MSNTPILGSYGDNSGSALMFRNKIINGACLVAQRGNIAAVNNAVTYGGADRFFVAPISFTTAAGTITKSALSGTAAGFGQWLSSTTTTGSGTVVFGQRIESQNTLDLNSKSVTFSGYLYQDTGSTVVTSVVVAKATAVDNFTAVTNLGSSNISVPTATVTFFSLTVSLGSTDASNGLSCTASFSVGAVTNKNFAVSSWQLEAGSIATPFENRPIGQVLQECQRYYEYFASYSGVTSEFGRLIVRPTMIMRTQPSVSCSSINNGESGAVVLTNPLFTSQAGASFAYSATGAGNLVWRFAVALQFSAEL